MTRAVGVSILCLVVLAGCGNDPASTESAADTSRSSVAAGPSAGVSIDDVSPCELLTADEVESATGLTVEGVRAEGPISCAFGLGDDAGIDIVVSVEDGLGRLAGPQAVFESYEHLLTTGEAEPIAGLGAAALYAGGYRGLVVDPGDGPLIALAVNGGFGALQDPMDALVRLATLALDRL